MDQCDDVLCKEKVSKVSVDLIMTWVWGVDIPLSLESEDLLLVCQLEANCSGSLY